MGGLVVRKLETFGGQVNIALAPDLKSDAWLEPTMSTIGLPLLVHFVRWTPPYTLRLQLWDCGAAFRSIDFTEIVVEYSDGTVVRRSERWSAGCVGMCIRVPALVTRHEALRLTLVGTLTRADGSRHDFRTTKDFSPHTDWDSSSAFLYWANG
jgi:hypothetical protein